MEMLCSTNKNSGFLRKVYEKILQEADTKRARFILCILSFAESSVFPLPPDILLIPMILANQAQAWSLAFYCTISSVLGGIVGYAIGYFLFSTFGEWVIQTYGLQSAFIKFQQDFQIYGFWIIALKGLTPIPFKLVTIASGVFQLNFITFIGASIVARAFRFYLLAGILWKFGPWAKILIEKYLTLVLLSSLAVIILGFIIVKML